MELKVGKISFGNTRIGHAIEIIKEEVIDKHMWEHECGKKDYEIAELLERIHKLEDENRRLRNGRKIKGVLRKSGVVRKSGAVRERR